ncbi:MAG: hypothetical protein K9M82_01075 [Deltaproteobacteria bacterium]|nr:hypothetical protein [Deltaproteobacteria bacterium]
MDPFPGPERQIRAWRRANRKMGWRIPGEAFQRIGQAPRLTPEDRRLGFRGIALCYGFGETESGTSDPVLSAERAWSHVLRRRRRRAWQCEYIRFGDPAFIRLRPGAPPRPAGFYFVKVNLGEGTASLSVRSVRRSLGGLTAWGPEGIQLAGIVHPGLCNAMNERKIPFLSLGDLDVAPYGFSDFFDAPQIFCSEEVMGLGIGNVDRVYPRFVVPTLRIAHRCTRS